MGGRRRWPDAGYVDTAVAHGLYFLLGKLDNGSIDTSAPEYHAVTRWLATTAPDEYLLWLITHPVYDLTAPFQNTGAQGSVPITNYAPGFFTPVPGLLPVLYRPWHRLGVFGVEFFLGVAIAHRGDDDLGNGNAFRLAADPPDVDASRVVTVDVMNLTGHRSSPCDRRKEVHPRAAFTAPGSSKPKGSRACRGTHGRAVDGAKPPPAACMYESDCSGFV